MGAPVVVVKPAESMVGRAASVVVRVVAKKVVEAMLEAPAERQAGVPERRRDRDVAMAVLLPIHTESFAEVNCIRTDLKHC